MKISRRTLLKLGLGGGVIVAAGGVGLSLMGTRIRKPRTALKVLDEAEFSVLAAFADRVSPGQGGWPSAWELRVPEKVDASLATVHPGDANDFKQALALLENAAAGLLDGRATPFSASSSAVQDETMRSWRGSEMDVKRTAFTALHKACSAAYWSSPEIYARVGYGGPPAFPWITKKGAPA